MKKFYCSFIFLFLFTLYIDSKPLVIYSDPVPNAKYVSVNNGIVIGFKSELDERTLTSTIISVRGEKSGLHEGEILFISGQNRILFKPFRSFEFNERVYIKLNKGIKTSLGAEVEQFSFSFNTQKKKIYRGPTKSIEDELAEVRKYIGNLNSNSPLDPPYLNVTISNNPMPGQTFLSNFPFNPNTQNIPYLIISENTGIPYVAIQKNASALDFKKQPNGNLTYYHGLDSVFYESDVNYNTIDQYVCGNGYTTDVHELIILDNGHSLLMSYDSQPVDMSKIVQGGNPNAIVIGLIIQELDVNKNVVFQWRSWDHFQITDPIYVNLLDSVIDYVHGNAIDRDFDGNILISSRHLDEITKINRITGDVIWRLGGRNNQFTFINDSVRFSYQHGIRRLQNGNIILYDNGNNHTPPYSRAVEYTLDEQNLTATLSWQYRNNPAIFGPAMGFAQRLSNGNTLISWGAANPTITEVTPDGKIALEMSLPQGIFTYRAFKDNWSGPQTIGPGTNDIPLNYSLSQNYPNPFNPSTRIKFGLPYSSFVSIKLYDILGREVATIVNTDFIAGFHTAQFNSSGFPSGVYFYTIIARDFKESKKMVIVK
ncbi:MAG: aryl-sulfate sulfotransferase [Chlorobi bacterium]|nr:aryl-sulfate sulfotransferase [Chlorobiota bacterium]MCI0715248.1 aryl-sulfate sulfotransferase [Chlorobiota bacterium]